MKYPERYLFLFSFSFCFLFSFKDPNGLGPKVQIQALRLAARIVCLASFANPTLASLMPLPPVMACRAPLIRLPLHYCVRHKLKD